MRPRERLVETLNRGVWSINFFIGPAVWDIAKIPQHVILTLLFSYLKQSCGPFLRHEIRSWSGNFGVSAAESHIQKTVRCQNPPSIRESQITFKRSSRRARETQFAWMLPLLILSALLQRWKSTSRVLADSTRFWKKQKIPQIRQVQHSKSTHLMRLTKTFTSSRLLAIWRSYLVGNWSKRSWRHGGKSSRTPQGWS